MDEEIVEALYENPFHRQEEMAISLFDENGTKKEFNDDIHVSSSEFDDNFQRSHPYFHDQEYGNHFQQQEETIEDSCYNVHVEEEIYSSCHFVSQFTTHEKNHEENIYETACTKTIDIEIIHGDIYP